MNQTRIFTYDLETFFNIFLFVGKFRGDSTPYIFEVSERKSQRSELLQFLNYLTNANVLMAGFNNVGFDYEIIHDLLNNPYSFDYTRAYNKGQEIITSFSNNDRFSNRTRPSDRIIPQVDWYKINHFDNANKGTRLKDLQFAMRSPSLVDLPYDPHSPLTSEQMDNLITYGWHDVTETEQFGEHCMHLLEMRQELLADGTLTGDVLNFADTKIGVEYLIKKIGRPKCFISGSKPRQSFRTTIPFKKVILPKTRFRTEPFDEVLQWFEKQVYECGEGVKPALSTKLAGVDFDFGVGGVHASVESKIYRANDEMMILDVDVAGMYPAVAIANNFAPEHLGQDFLVAYKQLSIDRKQYAKGSSKNKVLKLANNGVYGVSNNKYSCFFDPQYMLSVTLNGQLQLLQLAEALSQIPRLELIQANTDGITAYLPRSYKYLFQLWCDEWQRDTGLSLEHADYQSMYIADVNNYIAVDTRGKVKRKGRYWYPTCIEDYEGVWNKDFSQLIVPKAASGVMIEGGTIAQYLMASVDPFDFMLRTKATGQSKLYIGDKQTTKTVRYYISTKGEPMSKTAPPTGVPGAYKKATKVSDSMYEKIMREIGPGVWDERIHTKNKSVHAERTTDICKGYLVKECNVASDFDWTDVDFDYYRDEIEKLIIGEQNV